MKYLPILFLAFLISCKPSVNKLTAQQIIDKSIIASGADLVANAEIKFKFRDKTYLANRQKGAYTLISEFDSVKDVLTNNDFNRFINLEKQNLTDVDVTKYSNAVNSVHYFSVLPFGLNDKAVFKKLLPSAIVRGKEYYKVEVTFAENGGGEDFDDVFIYWVGKQDFLVDYLAYSYHTNGGGKRLRVLKDAQKVNGIRFVNFDNYKPLNKEVAFINIDKAYEKGQLKKISEIILENVSVKILK